MMIYNDSIKAGKLLIAVITIIACIYKFGDKNDRAYLLNSNRRRKYIYILEMAALLASMLISLQEKVFRSPPTRDEGSFGESVFNLSTFNALKVIPKEA